MKALLLLIVIIVSTFYCVLFIIEYNKNKTEEGALKASGLCGVQLALLLFGVPTIFNTYYAEKHQTQKIQIQEIKIQDCVVQSENADKTLNVHCNPL